MVRLPILYQTFGAGLLQPSITISSLIPQLHDSPCLAALLRVQRAGPQRCQLSGALRRSQEAQGEGEDFSAIINCISWLLEIVFLGN